MARQLIGVGVRVIITHLKLTGTVVTAFGDGTKLLIRLDDTLFTTDGILVEYLVSREPYVRCV